MKIKCFVHTDLDGVGCAILAYLAFGRENVDVEYCDYGDVDGKVHAFCETGLYRIYDYIYITDISIAEDTADYIQSECSKYVRELNWRLFDHHATALGLNKYDWCDVKVNAPVDSYFKTCGTELFAMYLYEGGAFDHHGSYVINNIDRFVGIVRDYDTWRWKDRGKEGVICKQVNDLFYIYGRDKFIAWCLIRLKRYGSHPVFPDFDAQDQSLLEQKQKDIDIYVEEKNKQLAQKIDEFGNMYGVVFAERYFSELGNRLCEMNPEIAYVAIIDICEGKVHYRTVREDIDVGGEIARSRGGGGHKKAARSEFDGERFRDGLVGLVFSKEPEGVELTRDSKDEIDPVDEPERSVYLVEQIWIMSGENGRSSIGIYDHISKAAWAIWEDIDRIRKLSSKEYPIPSVKQIIKNKGVQGYCDEGDTIAYKITKFDVE